MTFDGRGGLFIKHSELTYMHASSFSERFLFKNEPSLRGCLSYLCLKTFPSVSGYCTSWEISIASCSGLTVARIIPIFSFPSIETDSNMRRMLKSNGILYNMRI